MDVLHAGRNGQSVISELPTVSSGDYLQALYGQCERGDIVIVGPSRNHIVAHYPVTSLAQANLYIRKHPENLFIKVNPMNYQRIIDRNPYGVGGVAEVEAIVSFHFDADAGEKNGEKYVSQAGLLSALDMMPLPPSFVVLSDGDEQGFHFYWLTDRPFYVESDADRARASSISQRMLDQFRECVRSIDETATVDGTANIDRLLRPIGSQRSTGNIVRAKTWYPDQRYSLEQLEQAFPATKRTNGSAASSLSCFGSDRKHDGESVVDKYLDSIGLNTPEAILFSHGYERWNGSDRHLIRPGSNSGQPTGQIFELADGRRGFTVKSGAADPLSNLGRNGANGRWYSPAGLWVAFEHGDDWGAAARAASAGLPESEFDMLIDRTTFIELKPSTSTDPNPAHPGEIDALYDKLGIAKAITNRELLESTEINEYLIDGCLVRCQPLGIAGPSKAMKTTIAIDAAISLASGSAWLASHRVSAVQSVLFFTGEIGKATGREVARRIARAKGLSDDVGRKLPIHWAFWAPHILDADQMRIVAHELDRLQPAVAIFDPLYQMLDGSTQANYALNGQQLRAISELCIRRGITPILIDHAKRSSTNAAEYEPLELEDISGAGKAEFFRQWWLVNRRKKYDPDSPHDLWLAIGGSAGHSSLWALTIDERRDLDNQRDYALTIRPRSELEAAKKSDLQSRRELKEANDAARIARKADDLLTKVFKSDFAVVMTKTEVRDYLRVSTADAGQVIAHLLQEEKIQPSAIKKNGRSYDGYSLVGSLFGQPDKPDKPDTSGSCPVASGTGSTSTGLGGT